MRNLTIATACSTLLIGAFAAAQTPDARHNRVIELLEQKRPVFGLYAPSNARPGGPPGAARPATPSAPAKSPAELAREAAAYKLSDFVFDGSMEGDFDKAFLVFVEFAKGLAGAGVVARAPVVHLTHPMIVKAPEIAPDPKAAAANIGKQLNQGVSGVMLVTVESAEEARQGIAAMRFASHGGTRPDGDVGSAPTVWGMSETEYRRKADLWPLNRDGELINWTIVESKEGLAHLREIAAVPGIGVLWPGAGTLRRRVHDDLAVGRTRLRSGGVGSGDPAGVVGLQGVQDRLRVPGQRRRHPAADVAGLLGLRDGLGRGRLQDRRGRPQARRTRRLQPLSDAPNSPIASLGRPGPGPGP